MLKVEVDLITKSNSSLETANRKALHLKQSQEFNDQARLAIEEEGDWQRSGSLILLSLAEERKAECSGLQVMNVIKYRPKQRLEFNFRS